MSPLIVVIIFILLILALGGGGYHGYRTGWYGAPAYYGPGFGIVGLVLVILLIVFLLRGF
jgi:hypothetical protein